MRLTCDVLKSTRLRSAILALGFAALLAPTASAQAFVQPQVVLTPFTSTWPASFVGANLQVSGRTDLIVISRNVPETSPGYPLISIVPTAQFLNNGSGTLAYAQRNSPGFTATSLVPTIADFNGDGKQDVAYAISNAITGVDDLCVDFYEGGGAINVPVSGCTTLALVKSVPPQLTYAAAIPLITGGLPQLLLEDSANRYVYLVRNTGVLNTAAPLLPSFTVKSLYTLPSDGAGPISVEDLNGDGKLDFIINSQTGHSASVYLGNGDGTFQPPVRYAFSHNVHSLLLQDMDGDGHLDMVVEGDNGIIEIHHGEANATFDAASIGGTSAGLDGTTGNGGHLIAVADLNHDGIFDLLTATPIGVSVMLGAGAMTYLPAKIYNAGPGHTSYVLADFNSDGNQDLAVDSPEGVAILYGNADGSFQTSRAFAAGQPAMSGALGVFTGSGNQDAVVSTGTTQAQFLRGNGDGTFASALAPTTSQNGMGGLWSVIQAGDLDSDGNLDLLLTADGPAAALPQTATGAQFQLGRGDGTFASISPLIIPFNPPGCTQYPGYLYGVSALGTNLLGTVVIDRSDDGFHYFLNGNHHPPGGTEYFNSGIEGSTCGAFAHNITVSGVFTPRIASLQSVTDVFAQADGHLDLYTAYNNSDFGTSIGDLATASSLTSPGQGTAPALSHTFNGPAIPVASGGLGFPAFIGSAVSADLDRDGSQDLIVVYANLAADLQAPIGSAPNKIYIWFGTSATSNFLTSTKHPVNPVVLTPSRNYYQVAIADMDGDGIPDLILSDGYIVSIQRGIGDGTFGAETHYLGGQGINTISVGDTRGIGRNDLILANGGAVLTNPVANLEQLATNPDVNTGGITVLLNQTAALLTPNGSVAASPAPSTYGDAFSIVLTFSSSTPAPSGSVTFSVDGVVVGTTMIVGNSPAGVIYGAPSTLAVGAHTLTAFYSGDSHYQSGTFSGSHTVAMAVIGSVIATPEPSAYGSSFVLNGTAPGPGQFTFYVDGTAVGSATSSNGMASVVVPGTYNVGTHALTLAWTGSMSTLAVNFAGTHQVIQNPTTLSLLLCVDPPGSAFPCGTPLSATPLISPITFFFGQSLDGVATESATNLGGNIVFYNNANIFCTIPANLTGGSNMCPPQSGYFNAGNYTVYATYTGDANNSQSISNQIQVNVFADTTTASLHSSSNPAVVGTTVAFSLPISGSFATPTGTVSFHSGSPVSNANLIGTAILDATGNATVSTSSLAVGTYTITAVYGGNSNFSAVQSSITQVITPAVVSPPPPTGTGFTLTVTPDPVLIGVGATGILLVKVTGQSNQTPQVSLTCSGLPDEASCIFVTPTLPTGGGATTLQLHVTAPHDCGSNTPYFIGSESGPASPAPYAFAAIFLGSLAIFRRRKTLQRTLLLILTALVGLASLSGCGHCTDLGTRPGNYSFTVIATPVGTSTSGTESVTVPLNVFI